MSTALVILMMRFRWFGASFGVLACLGCSWVTWTTVREAAALEVKPERMPATRLPLEVPRPGLFVALSGVIWDCDRAVRDPEGRTIVPGLVGERRVFAWLGDSPVSCSTATRTEVVGLVSDISSVFADHLRDAGLEVSSPSGVTTLELCTTCSLSNSRTGVAVSATLAVLSFLVGVLCAWAPWRPRIVALGVDTP